MNQTKNAVISFADIVKQLPGIVKKLPSIAVGLPQAYLRKGNISSGLAWAFERAVRKNPQGDALYYENQKFTYEQLNEWSNQISHYFLSLIHI